MDNVNKNINQNINENIIENEKEIIETLQDFDTITPEDQEKIRAAVYELIDYFRQIWAVNNTLHLLYNLLEVEEPEIAEPASAMEVCMQQLDYIHKHSFEVLDTILESSGFSKYFGY